jgi:DNA-directed RNA polymerase specialized sigma24 family protein
MRYDADPYIYASPLIEPLSLDAICMPGEDGDFSPLAIADPAPDAEDQMALAQARTAIEGFIGTLDARDQDLIERIFWNDERQADVARALDLSGAAISKRMNRIVQRGRIALACLRGSLLLQQ